MFHDINTLESEIFVTVPMSNAHSKSNAQNSSQEQTHALSTLEKKMFQLTEQIQESSFQMD